MRNPSFPEMLKTAGKTLGGAALAAGGIIGAGMLAKQYKESPQLVAAGTIGLGVLGGGVIAATLSPAAGSVLATTLFTAGAGMLAAPDLSIKGVGAVFPVGAAAGAAGGGGIGSVAQFGQQGIGSVATGMRPDAHARNAQVGALVARFA